MKTDEGKVSKAELRKVVTRAVKKAMDALKQEPSVVIVSGSEDVAPDRSIEEITSWLFREENNGS
jgi:hypothetical protein